jgi:hypothetical protein
MDKQVEYGPDTFSIAVDAETGDYHILGTDIVLTKDQAAQVAAVYGCMHLFEEETESEEMLQVASFNMLGIRDYITQKSNFYRVDDV